MQLCATASLSALVLAGLVPARQAHAQQAAAASGGKLEEVVVTAQRRRENVQKVPIAVTAFTARALKEKGITDVSGLTRLTPNVNLDTASAFGGANEVLSASIRGIGQDDFAINFQPGVGVYVDGVYYARTTGANVNMLDVDRVEILKGPQGTLFGRNTIGGAISIVTRDPSNDYHAALEAATGSFNRRDFQGSVDLPIIPDVLTSTFTFASLNRDGYQKRIPFPTAAGTITDPPGALLNDGTDTYNRQGGQGQDSLRYKMVWKPDADIRVTAAVDWTHADESSTAESLLDAYTGSTLGGLYDGCVAGVPGFLGPGTNIVCGPRGPGGKAPGLLNNNPGLQGSNRLFWGPQYILKNVDQSYGVGPDFNHLDNFGGALTASWDVTPTLNLKSITGYRRLNWDVALSTDASPIELNSDAQKQAQHQVSQELQANGSLFDGRLKFTSGLYYFNEGGFEHDYVAIAGGTLQVNGLSTIDTSSYAAYFHADYAITEQLKVIVGARYSIDDERIQVDQSDLNGFFTKLYGCYPLIPSVLSSGRCTGAPTGLNGGTGFPVPGNPLLFTPDVPYSRTFDVFTPTVGLQYQITPDAMAYATYSKGYKDGGWTTRLTNFESVLPSFGPEKSKTYEVGLKTEWFDHSLLLNLAGFYTDYDGIQLNFQEGLSPTIQNAGNARIMGSELSGNWIVGDGFSIAGTAGYMDAQYTNLQPGLNGTNTCVQPYSPCITLGSKLPKTPKWKTSISPTYTYFFHNESGVRFGVDYTYTAVIYNDSFNTSVLKRPDVNDIDISLTYMAPRDRYELVLGGTNITNQRYLTTGNEDYASGLIYGTYNPPGEWYLKLRAKF